MDRIISLTELQKLSLKKLRKVGAPLFVMDIKSRRKAYVILDMESYDAMVGHPNMGSRIYPFRDMGLLWDRSKLSDQDFFVMLMDPNHREHPWAMKRLLEYAPSHVVTRLFSLEDLRKALKGVRLRPIYAKAWSHAIHYWSQNP